MGVVNNNGGRRVLIPLACCWLVVNVDVDDDDDDHMYMQEDRRRAASGGASHRQPSQRSLSLLGPRPSTPSTPSPVVAETGTPLLSKLATLPAHLQGGFDLGASLRVDTPQAAIKPNQAVVPSAAEAAAAEVAQGGGEVAEEAEEGELEPGERGADWESDPEEEAGSQAEPAEASGRLLPDAW